ncbi:cytochrome P450 [Penicillium herquei]|nr:cytochrome P450 [Penicillium herquei]
MRILALTYLYESYYEIILGGQYFKRVSELHKIYVVRVTPNEVHFNDPEFIDMVYPGPARKTNKPIWFAQRTGTPHSIVSTPDHSLHRQRRNALNSFFSVASIRRLEPIMKTYMKKMFKILDKAGNTGQILHMHHLFKACASDVITVYAFGECFNFLDQPDHGRSFFESTDVFFYLTHIFGLVPWLVHYVQNMPSWLVKLLLPSLSELRDRQDWWISKVREIRKSPNPERIKSTIFEGIPNSSLPAEEKEDERLASEAQLMVFAGEGTTVRLHPGVMARQVRISPEIPIIYQDKPQGKTYIIPPNTVTSISPLDIHMHPAAFGNDAYTFRPQRFIDDPKLGRMTLARREMAIILATSFLKYDVYDGSPEQGPTLELYDTQRARDIDANMDYIIPVPARGSEGLRMRVRNHS